LISASFVVASLNFLFVSFFPATFCIREGVGTSHRPFSDSNKTLAKNAGSVVQFIEIDGSIGRISLMSSDSTNRFGDKNAAQQQFLSLFLRSEREIFRYVAVLVPNVTDAEDIVQQTAISLWEKFEAYDPAQPFTPWACRFALNKARQWIERRQRWQELLESGLAEELARRREELRPELECRLKHLEGCLRKLPEEQRSLVEAYYYERAEIETLSERSGRTVAATYKALQRIRQALLICVERSANPEGAT
jgi:RNA polymerase sigma-70 factor, ECF subfamily